MLGTLKKQQGLRTAWSCQWSRLLAETRCSVLLLYNESRRQVIARDAGASS